MFKGTLRRNDEIKYFCNGKDIYYYSIIKSIYKFNMSKLGIELYLKKNFNYGHNFCALVEAFKIKI